HIINPPTQKRTAQGKKRGPDNSTARIPKEELNARKVESPCKERRISSQKRGKAPKENDTTAVLAKQPLANHYTIFGKADVAAIAAEEIQTISAAHPKAQIFSQDSTRRSGKFE